jgi:phage major head subunit gpT-like protein
MTTRSTAFSHLLAPGLNDILFNKYNQYPDEYTQIFNVENTTRAYEEDAEVAGLGKFVTKAEGQVITYDEPFQSANKKRYTPAVWALGFRVSYELYKNDLYGIIKKMPASLARSAKQTVEAEAWSVLNNAFNAAKTGLDGVSLCNTAHPSVNLQGGPYSNRLSTDADLSITSLQSAIQLMEGTTDDRDLNLMIKPKLLVCHYSNKWAARELLNSEKKPYTADNEINALSDEELKYMVGHYLTDEDAWFLMSGKEDHNLKLFWREKLRMDNDDDFDTGDAKFKGMMWFDYGFSGWRGIAGSPGD